MTEVADISEMSGGYNVSQPVSYTVTDKCRVMRKQWQLRLLNSVIRRNASTVRNRREDTCTVYHLLIHKVYFTVAPCTSGSLTVGNSVCEIYSMSENMTAESCLNGFFRLCETLCLHFRTYITTFCDIRIVHNVIVKRAIGYDYSMVSSQICITTTIVVIESGDSPIHTVDYPVVTDV